jgi:hypothetical protein
MLILEECIHEWPMQDMRAQIDALREAFSADKDRAFELKASFPYTSPSESHEIDTPLEGQAQSRPTGASHTETLPQSQASSHPLQMMTPPVSTVSRDSTFGSPSAQAHQLIGTGTENMDHLHQLYSSQPVMPILDETQWNPSPIFDQWNSAFSIPQAALGPPPPASATSPPSSQMHFSAMPPNSAGLSRPTSSPYISQHPASIAPSFTSAPHPSTFQQATYPTGFVSSKQWQRSVASVVDSTGLKRMWPEFATDMQSQQRMR